jgi:hypothetical protein
MTLMSLYSRASSLCPREEWCVGGEVGEEVGEEGWRVWGLGDGRAVRREGPGRGGHLQRQAAEQDIRMKVLSFEPGGQGVCNRLLNCPQSVPRPLTGCHCHSRGGASAPHRLPLSLKGRCLGPSQAATVTQGAVSRPLLTCVCMWYELLRPSWSRSWHSAAMRMARWSSWLRTAWAILD